MSSLDVSSATQLHGDYNMDVEQEVLSPAVLDHAYHATYPAGQNDNSDYRTPHQTTDTIEGGNAIQESSESEAEDVKPDLAELNTVTFDDISLSKNPIQQANDLSSAVSGYIQSIPVTEVPYNVTHEDIAKALSVNEEKVPVRIMRKVIPCLRITAYMKEAEFSGKKKIKGLWTNSPEDWQKDIPYKDPNNGEKIDGKLVPKANSEELRQMFKFLKNKVMRNIHEHINQLTAEELKQLTEKGNSSNGTKMGQYYFETLPQQPPPCKLEVSSTSSKYQATAYPAEQQSTQLSQNYDTQYKQLQQMQQQQHHPVKLEPVTTFVPAAPDNQTSIPTFVANDEFSGSSPEQQVNSSPDTSIDPSIGHKLVIDASMNDSDTMQDSESSEDGYAGIFYDEKTGESYYVQMPTQDDTSSVESGDSITNQTEPVRMIQMVSAEMLPHQSQHIAPGVAKQDIKMPVKRQASVEPKVSQINSGKRIKDEGISRGPIQQVSTQQSYKSPIESAAPKAMVEVAPQKRSTPLTQPVEHLQTSEVMVNSPTMHPGTPLSFSTHSPVAIYPSGPAMSPFSQQIDFNRFKLLEEMFIRLKDKIMKLTSLVLGDVEISVALNKLYNDVVRLHYEKAQVGHQNQFVTASHACEALLDRAMLDGKNYPKEEFIGECNKIIENFGTGKVEHTQKTTVLTVTAPEPPPIQAERYAKLQRKSIDDNPFSPTGLSNQLSNLDIANKKVDLSDPRQFGIMPRTSEKEVSVMLDGIVEPFKQQAQPMEDDENMLILPEKLQALGVETDLQQFDEEVVRDLLKQLSQLPDYMKPTETIETKSLKPTVHIENAVDVAENNAKLSKPEDNQKIGPAVDNSCYTGPIKNYVMWHGEEPISELDKDDIIDEVLGLETDYKHFEIQWKPPGQEKATVERSADKTPMQPSTPDDGNICIATTFNNNEVISSKLRSYNNHTGSHKKKPYQRPIQPKPQQPSYNPNIDIQLTNPVIWQSPGSDTGLFPATKLAPAQVTPVQQPVASVYIQNNNFGGGGCYQYQSSPPEPASCIPEVVENFDSPQACPSYEDSSRRPRGRKRVVRNE